MSNNKLVPELNDIGKFVDREALKQAGIQTSGHTFHDFDFSQIGISQPTSPSWYAQFTDEVGSLTSTKVPQDYISDVLLTNIADEVAASISRTWGEKGEVAEGLNKLWDPDYYQREEDAGKKWAAFTTPDKLKEMFQFIEECNSSEEFFERYGENLRLTAEDKSAPVNIVDLFTHLELTGKICRVLKKHSRFDTQKKNQIYFGNYFQIINYSTGGRINKTHQKGKWIYRLIFCSIFFPQNLIRLQDLNILKKRADLIKSFSEDENTKDYALFFTDDFMCLFTPQDDEVRVKELLEPFLKAGFIIDYLEMEAELNLLTSSMERAYEKFHSLSTTRHLKLYEKRESFDFPPEIPPNLCDSCQMGQGEERVKGSWNNFQNGPISYQSIKEVCDKVYNNVGLDKDQRYKDFFEKNILFGNKPKEIAAGNEEGEALKIRESNFQTIDVIPQIFESELYQKNNLIAEYKCRIPFYYVKNDPSFFHPEEDRFKEKVLFCNYPYSYELGLQRNNYENVNDRIY